MSRSIGVRILLTTSLIVTIISGAFIVYFEGHARTVVINRLTSSLSETAKVTASSISNWILIRSRLTEALANNVEMLSDLETPEPVLAFMRHPIYTKTFLTSYIGAESGTTHTFPHINLPDTYDPRKRPWYMDAKAYGGTMITEPYVDAFTGKMVMSTVTPIYHEGIFAGAAGGDIVLTDIIKLVQQIDLGNLGYAFLVNQKGIVLIHPDAKHTLQPIATVFPDHTPDLSQREVNFDDTQGQEIYAFFPVPGLPAADWKLGIAINRDKAFETITDFRKTAVVASLCTILTIIALMGLSIRQRIIRPLNQMTCAMKRLSEGDLTVDIPSPQSRDEIGDMSHAMHIFKTNALEMETMREEKQRAIQQAEDRKRQALEAAASRFEGSIVNIVELLSAAASSLNSAAVDMSVIADSSADLASAGAQASSETSDHVAAIATATEELSTSICEINRQSEKAVTLATTTLETLEQSHPTTETLDRIKDHVSRLREANGILTTAVTQQSSATEEISRSVQQAAIKADEAAQSIMGVKTIAKETDTSALNISSAAADLAMQTDLLQIAADDFLQHIRDE